MTRAQAVFPQQHLLLCAQTPVDLIFLQHCLHISIMLHASPEHNRRLCTFVHFAESPYIYLAIDLCYKASCGMCLETNILP